MKIGNIKAKVCDETMQNSFRFGTQKGHGHIMSLGKKVTLLTLAFILTLNLTGCGGDAAETTAKAAVTEDPDKELIEEVDWESIADIGAVDVKNEAGTGELYETGKTAGKVKALCYYELEDEDFVELFATRYGGVIETEICSSGSSYFERLGLLIQAGDSPDIVRFEWTAFPHGTSKNLFTPLDGWLDIESPVWSDLEEAISAYTYGGSNYYFPSNVKLHFGINYNRAVLDEAGLDDPIDLYLADEWTWDSFERLCKEWASQGEEYIAFTGGSWSSMLFIHTTGTSLIDIQGNEIINNMKSANVHRSMEWIENLKKLGYIGDGFIAPGDAFLDGKLLFLGMDPQWTFEGAQETLWKNGIEVDMAVVPFPRDPQADAYYTSVDTYGFLVPAGASNIQGGVSWIMSARLYEIDEEVVAAEKAKKTSTEPDYFDKCAGCKYSFTQNGTGDLTVCPECDTPRKEKFKAVYPEQIYDLWLEYVDPDKFTFVFDFATGFNDEFTNLLIGTEDSVLDGPMYYGSSYTQLSEVNYISIESYLDPYREAMANF